MVAQGSKPDFIDCGHCGASTAVEWVPVGQGAFQAGGRCPSCRWIVHSFYSEDPVFFDSLLPVLLAIPDTRIALHYCPSGLGGAGPS